MRLPMLLHFPSKLSQDRWEVCMSVYSLYDPVIEAFLFLFLMIWDSFLQPVQQFGIRNSIGTGNPPVEYRISKDRSLFMWFVLNVHASTPHKSVEKTYQHSILILLFHVNVSKIICINLDQVISIFVLISLVR